MKILNFRFLIWQVHFDAFYKSILLELRAEKTGEIHFLGIFFEENSQEFKVDTKENNDFDFWQMPERFWVVIRKLQYNLAFFQCYPDNTRPEMVGIWVIDILSKKILWKEPLAKFVEIENDKITYQIQNEKFTQFIFEEKDFSKKKGLYKTLYPEYYTQDLEYFDIVKDFLQKYFPDEIPLYELAYLETQKYLFIAYYFEQILESNIKKKASYCIFEKEKNKFIFKKNFEDVEEGFVRFWVYANYWIFTPTYKDIILEKI